MKEIEHERRDWIIVVIILLFGLLCVILAGQWAVRFAPTWKLNADMGSKLDPNVDYLTKRPSLLVEAVDSSILTEPVWIDVYLTPDAIIPTRVRLLDTATPTSVPTKVPPTSTSEPASTPTSTLVLIPPTPTATSKPSNTKTSTPTAGSTPAATFTPTTTATSTATPTNTPTPTNTSTPTSTPTVTATSTPTATPTNTPPPQADLQITITDNAATYDASSPIQYIILVSNPVGPSGVTGAIASGSFSPNLTNITWSCTTTGGATCANNTGPFGDTVDLPVGSSITYTVNATVATVNGDLVTTVNIAPPAGITDPVTSNNSATDIDTPIIPDTTPPQIGTTPDPLYDFYVVATNSMLTLQLSSPILVNGGGDGWDLIYYEWMQGSATTSPGIWMDIVILQVSDGKNWYTILNWGNNNPDLNASMNMNAIGVGSESDNQPLDAAFMYNLTGIGIELDNFVPNGSYKYLRIISPAAPPDGGDGVEVDAIYIVP